jgi:TonB family protein
VNRGEKMTENFFFKALFISLAAHTAILCAAYLSKINDPHYKAIHQHRIEISYNPAYKRAVDIREHPIRPAQRLDLSNNQKFLSDGTIPVSLVKDKPTLPFGMLYERKSERMHTMELSRRISIMPITSEKINNPVYAAYNEMVRDRIKERVYANYDKMEGGSVYLAFMLDQNGALTAAQIVPSKTTASAHLQEIAMRSLKEASPFPAFLKGMNLSEYPFNIEIQYQVSD